MSAVTGPTRPIAAPSRTRRRLGTVVQQAILLLGSVVALFPLWFMAWSALRTQADYARAPFGWPAAFTLDNVARAFGEDMGRWIVNSLVVTGGSVVLVGAGLRAGGLRLRAAAVQGVGDAAAGLRLPDGGAPDRDAAAALFADDVAGRVNHFDAVVVAYAGLMFPFSVFLMVRFIEGIPHELYEAAIVEGAGHGRILWTIVVPLVRPALLTLGIVNALWAWNELLIAVVMLQDEDARTLQAGLALLKGKNTVDIPLVMAGATISAIPLLLLYVVGQRFFMSGLLAGAVKE
jgi:ABC-type glycerol-3-phosphate transport system permease component